MTVCKVLSFPTPCERVPQATHHWDTLDFLRTAALRARLLPHVPPERACALIAADPAVSAARYARAFFQALAEVSIRDLALHHKGVRHATADESWLDAVIKSLHRGDFDSAALMMNSRILPLGRRRMFALTCGLANALKDLDLTDQSSIAS